MVFKKKSDVEKKNADAEKCSCGCDISDCKCDAPFLEMQKLIAEKMKEGMKDSQNQKMKTWSWCNCKQSKFSGFGFMLLIIGFIWLAKELGWLTINLPFWPIALIVIGLYFLVSKVLQ